MSQHKTSRRKHSKTEEHIPFKIVGYSVACERHIQRNEDSFIIEKHNGLAAVFDGVGGSAAGEIASRTAARATRQGWREALQQVRKGRHVDSFLEDCDKTDFCVLLQSLIEKADDLVRTRGRSEQEPMISRLQLRSRHCVARVRRMSIPWSMPMLAIAECTCYASMSRSNA